MAGNGPETASLHILWLESSPQKTVAAPRWPSMANRGHVASGEGQTPSGERELAWVWTMDTVSLPNRQVGGPERVEDLRYGLLQDSHGPGVLAFVSSINTRIRNRKKEGKYSRHDICKRFSQTLLDVCG